MAHKVDMFDNPLTPMSDQDRIFPYNIIQYQGNKWWEFKKIYILITGLYVIVHPIPNSQ